MELVLKYKEKSCVVLLDDEDFEVVSKYKWSIQCNKSGIYYARGHIRGERGKFYMHRIITNCPRNRLIDHINGNGLDNRKTNLRKCTKTENSFNTRGTRKYPYKGIERSFEKWAASITYRGIRAWLGRYDTMEEAAKAYDVFAEKIHGEFFNPNFPES